MSSWRSSGNFVGSVDGRLGFRGAVGEDGGVLVLFDDDDELEGDGAGDVSIKDSRHFRAPLVGVLTTVDRGVGLMRRNIGFETPGADADCATVLVQVVDSSTSP